MNSKNILAYNMIIKLSNNTNMNDNIIKFIKYKQSLYKLIYNLNKIKFKLFKGYIKTYIKTRFFKNLLQMH